VCGWQAINSSAGLRLRAGMRGGGDKDGWRDERSA